jgi:thiol-disulfide isomerase/thioredoxin
MHLIKLISFFTLLSVLTGCLEDLKPASKDLRSGDTPTSENFIALTTLNKTVTLENELLNNDAVVLYFTMWCPLCDSHMSHMRSEIIDNYRNVSFYMVDYVSANLAQSLSSQRSNGYAGLQLLVDNQQSLLNQYNATMASVVVIDDQKKILLNEDYKNGARLINILDNLGGEQ